MWEFVTSQPPGWTMTPAPEPFAVMPGLACRSVVMLTTAGPALVTASTTYVWRRPPRAVPAPAPAASPTAARAAPTTASPIDATEGFFKVAPLEEAGESVAGRPSKKIDLRPVSLEGSGDPVYGFLRSVRIFRHPTVSAAEPDAPRFARPTRRARGERPPPNPIRAEGGPNRRRGRPRLRRERPEG